MIKRIETIFNEQMSGDNSFSESWFPKFYSQKEMRKNWYDGIKYGIELGLYKASLEGQKLELYHNIKNDENQKEFLDKFFKLANEYNCAIQYHPTLGMTVIKK